MIPKCSMSSTLFVLLLRGVSRICLIFEFNMVWKPWRNPSLWVLSILACYHLNRTLHLFSSYPSRIVFPVYTETVFLWFFLLFLYFLWRSSSYKLRKGLVLQFCPRCDPFGDLSVTSVPWYFMRLLETNRLLVAFLWLLFFPVIPLPVGFLIHIKTYLVSIQIMFVFCGQKTWYVTFRILAAI